MQSTLSRTRKSAAFGHVFSRAPCAQIRSSFTPQPPKIKFLIFCCWDEWRAWVTQPECGRHEGQCQEPRKGLQLEVGAPRLLVGTYISRLLLLHPPGLLLLPGQSCLSRPGVLPLPRWQSRSQLKTPGVLFVWKTSPSSYCGTRFDNSVQTCHEKYDYG